MTTFTVVVTLYHMKYSNIQSIQVFLEIFQDVAIHGGIHGSIGEGGGGIEEERRRTGWRGIVFLYGAFRRHLGDT